MAFKKKFLFLSFVSVFLCPLLADQIPYVYTNGGPIRMTLSGCISTAKKEMKLAGFTRNMEVLYDSANSHSATIFSIHSFKPVAITYRCMTDINTRTFGISSLDNQQAWDAYTYFHAGANALLKNR